MKIKYPLKFKAAILQKNNKPLLINEVIFEGPLQAGQVLTKIYYSGICGKQIEEIQGTRPDPFFPHMLGHEGSGVVVDIGQGVKKVLPGDKVVLHWTKGRGINSDTPIYNKNGQKINAGCITTFNEYGIISENRLTPLSKNSDLEVACLLGCCVTSGVGVVFNEANPLPEESIAVFGCGGVGLNSIQAARIKYCNPIIAVDKNKENLTLAKKLGATHIINIESEDTIKKIREITNPHKGKIIIDAKNMNLKEPGADYVICAVSNPEVIEIAIESCSIPGKVYLVGVPPYSSKISMNAFDIHAGRTIQGSHGGDCIPERDIPKYMRLYEKGFLKFKELISNEVSLEHVNEGIELLKKGILGRCIISMNHTK